MNDDRTPLDPKKVQLIRESLEKYLFSDVQHRSDEQMWTHFTFNERPKRSEIRFNRLFLEECNNLDELMEKSIIPLLVANPGKTILVGEMGVLSVQEKDDK